MKKRGMENAFRSEEPRVGVLAGVKPFRRRLEIGEHIPVSTADGRTLHVRRISESDRYEVVEDLKINPDGSVEDSSGRVVATYFKEVDDAKTWIESNVRETNE